MKPRRIPTNSVNGQLASAGRSQPDSNPSSTTTRRASRSAPNIPPSTTLWLIRHAEVEQRYQNVFGGRIDMGLSSRGHEQSAALGRYLRGKPIHAIYASPMKRARQTLASLSFNGAPQPVILEDLREVDFGDWTGLRWGQVETKYGVSALDWLERLECAGIPNAESSDSLRGRVEPCLRQILTDYAGRQTAILCHGGVIRMLLAILLGWPLKRMAAFEIDYASLTQVVWEPPLAKLQLVNFTPWRELA